MPELQNVQIPLALFNSIIWFFEYLSITDQQFPDSYDFVRILSDLRRKQTRLNKHSAYANIIYARDEVQRDLARKNYLRLKQKNTNN